MPSPPDNLLNSLKCGLEENPVFVQFLAKFELPDNKTVERARVGLGPRQRLEQLKDWFL